MTKGQKHNVNALTGLGLAKYVLEKIVDQNESIEKIAEDFDNDDEFI
jgi:hypothetical protein